MGFEGKRKKWATNTKERSIHAHEKPRSQPGVSESFRHDVDPRSSKKPGACVFAAALPAEKTKRATTRLATKRTAAGIAGNLSRRRW
jgi:hypothetical protein